MPSHGKQAYRPRVETLEARELLANYTVVNTDYSGAGSLRQAITDANANAGLDTIAFNIPGPGLHSISTYNLPYITDAVMVDGTSQPGYSGMPLIELDGVFAGFDGAALWIRAMGRLSKGLSLTAPRTLGAFVSTVPTTRYEPTLLVPTGLAR